MVVVEYRTLEYMVIICFLRYIFDKNRAKVTISVFDKKNAKVLTNKLVD